jgi:type II secretory pathway component PulM
MTVEQFDKHWRLQTRRRFGALALVTNVSAAVGFFALLLGPLFWMRRRRDRARLELMRQLDAAQEQAARDSALEAILNGAPGTAVTSLTAEPAPEDDGSGAESAVPDALRPN